MKQNVRGGGKELENKEGGEGESERNLADNSHDVHKQVRENAKRIIRRISRRITRCIITSSETNSL
jgi:hypothetical protein